jgi:hypothetical protein
MREKTSCRQWVPYELYDEQIARAKVKAVEEVNA